MLLSNVSRKEGIILRNWKLFLAISQAVLFVLCAVDGICTILGVPGTETNANVLLGNLLSTLFFVPMAAGLFYSWKTLDIMPMKLIQLLSIIVLAGSTVLLLLIAMTLPAPQFVSLTFTVLLFVLNLPALNCSNLFLPMFAWAVLLISSTMLIGKLRKR